MQKRSIKKPLWPLFWANTCCSHPRKDLPLPMIAHRRLQEECGVTCDLNEVGTYVYRAEDSERNGIEHEYVTMLRGNLDGDKPFVPNPDEVAELKWIDINELQADMAAQPEKYAPWFHLGLQKILKAP